MLLRASYLPDPPVLPAPHAADVISDSSQPGPLPFGQPHSEPDQVVRRPQQLPVNVQLPLQGRGVAHPHRARVAIPVQVAEVVFVQVGLAAEPVQDLNPGGIVVLLRRAFQELEEGDSFVLLPEHGQRLADHAGVADPAEPVVPVAHTSDVLRQ